MDGKLWVFSCHIKGLGSLVAAIVADSEDEAKAELIKQDPIWNRPIERLRDGNVIDGVRICPSALYWHVKEDD